MTIGPTGAQEQGGFKPAATDKEYTADDYQNLHQAGQAPLDGHHQLGVQANQAARGNHAHDVRGTEIAGSVAESDHAAVADTAAYAGSAGFADNAGLIDGNKIGAGIVVVTTNGSGDGTSTVPLAGLGFDTAIVSVVCQHLGGLGAPGLVTVDNIVAGVGFDVHISGAAASSARNIAFFIIGIP